MLCSFIMCLPQHLFFSLMPHGENKRSRLFEYFSLFFRYHKVGLLVLFVHDIADLWLDLTKLLHYLGVRQGGRKIRQYENAASATFVIFTLSWYVQFGYRFNFCCKHILFRLIFRLYLFPVKVLYSASVVFPYRTYLKGSTLYGFCNLLLWILQALNVYWFFVSFLAYTENIFISVYMFIFSSFYNSSTDYVLVLCLVYMTPANTKRKKTNRKFNFRCFFLWFWRLKGPKW